MSPVTSHDDPGNPGSSWRRRAEVIEQFEERWQQDGFADIADYLSEFPAGPGRAELLGELVKVDLERRWHRGERQRVEAYTTRFPELGDACSLPIDLISEEIRVRRLHECPPTREELAQRFPTRSVELDRLLDKAALAASSGLLSNLTKIDGESGTNVMATADRHSVPAHLGRVAHLPCRLGRYELLERIGTGGFSTVYRARDLELGRSVAVKVPRADLLEASGTRGRVLREAQSAARLRHPAIVPIHEVAEHDGVTFIVYDFISGPTLTRLLQHTTPSPQQAAEWVARLAEALDYAHETGIVHRDVKPANVMMDERGQPMLTDFGLALHADDATLTQAGDILGTPAYMAPEQARGEGHAADARTDVYGLGVLLYEMISGRLPFQGNAPSILHKVLHDEPASPRQWRSHVPLDLETICLKAMAKEAGRRYATAGAMAEDLRAYLEHRPISARRIGPIGRVARWCRRRPALATTIALAVTAIAIVTGFSYRQVLGERDRFRAERDRAQENLYRSLLSDAQAQLRSRDTGWWWKAMDNIRDAAKLNVASRDAGELRELAIQCMGTQYPCFRLHAEWEGHASGVVAVAFSSDGHLIASGSRDQTVHVRDAVTGRTIAVLAGHDGTVTGVAFHPSGKLLASCSADGSVRLWSTAAWLGLSPRSPGQGNEDLAVATRPQVVGSDIDNFAAATRPQTSGRGIEDSAAATPVESIDLKGGPVRAMSFSPHGEGLAAACADGAVRLLTIDGNGSDNLTTRKDARVLRGHTGAVISLAFMPNGKRLASGALDQTVRFWDVESGQLIATWPTDNTPSSVACSRANELAVAGAEGFGFKVKTLESDVIRGANQLHAGAISRLRYDWRLHVLTGSVDGTVRMWPRDAFTELAVAQGEFPAVLDFALSPDERWLAAGYSDGKVRLWELADPPQRALGGSQTQNAVFAGNQSMLVDGRIAWDLSQGPPGTQRDYTQAVIGSMAVHPDGCRFAFSDDSGTVSIWNWQERKALARLVAEDEPIRSVAGSPDGKWLATTSPAGAVKLWNWDTQALERTFEPGVGPVYRLAWSGDGRHLAVIGQTGGVVWPIDRDAKEGDGKPRTLGPHVLSQSSLAFGAGLIAFSAPDGSVEIQDLESGQTRQTLGGFSGEVTALAFSPDGLTLAAACSDQTIQLWDTRTGARQGTMSQGNLTLNVSWLAFEPSGHYLMSGGSRISVAWDLRTRLAAAWRGPGSPCGEFLPDGSGILLGTQDGSVLLWRLADIENGRAAIGNAGERDPLDAVRVDAAMTIVAGSHVSTVWGLAASSDGRWFATASHDQTVKLWDARTQRLVRTFEGHTDVVWCVAFSRDSKLIASGGAGVRIWEWDPLESTCRHASLSIL